ncbi:hypothetical protein ACFFNY_05780 [Paenibacillus hodogayensis]|uniref:Uncharacterized protein n=1 Tax=Paenibacillus hodogayensis TaxID=279208 RepID=A0ABV5VS15_9BACL
MRQQRIPDKASLPARTGVRWAAGVRLLALSIAALLMTALAPLPAQANVIDKVKGWMQLPGQVDELRDQYDTTKQQLEDASKQIDEAMRKSQETVEQYRQAEQQLRLDNERLAKQNEQLALQNEHLTQAVNGLQQAEQTRTERSKRTWTLIWTAVILVFLYFVSSRLFRLLLRSRHL